MDVRRSALRRERRGSGVLADLGGRSPRRHRAAAVSQPARTSRRPRSIADLSNSGFIPLANGSDGGMVGASELIGGLDALKHIEPAVVNLLCIPAAATLDGSSITATRNCAAVAGQVAAFCDTYRCFYLLDIPEGVDSTVRVVNWLGQNTIRDRTPRSPFPGYRSSIRIRSATARCATSPPAARWPASTHASIPIAGSGRHRPVPRLSFAGSRRRPAASSTTATAPS